MHKFDALSITFARLGIILSSLARAIGQQNCVQFNFFITNFKNSGLLPTLSVFKLYRGVGENGTR
jgi:hypothetical protein